MSKVLVTGASGFIAQQLIVDLLERGYAVRGTIRSLTKEQRLRDTLAEHCDRSADLELVAADLEADAGWQEAMEGIACVMHLASPFPLAAPKDPQELIGPARDGALRVLRAAKQANVPRVVMTSSCAAVAYGYKTLPQVLTEGNWTDPEYTKDCPPYPASKAIAERAAWDYVAGEGKGLELTVINPVGVFGPILSADVRASISVIEQLLGGKVPMAPNAGVQVVDVRDISAAHIAAMEKLETAGQRYAVGGDFYTMLDTANVLRKAFPDYAGKLPSRTIPSFIIRLLALFNAEMKTASFELDKRRYVSGEKAQRELLGRPYISGDEALIASAETLIKYGAL